MLSAKRKDEWDGTKSIYSSLRDELQTYYDIAKRGGWSTIPPVHKSIKKGKSNPVITLIKKRLQLTGELHGSDTSALFNESLQDAVKVFQLKLGYTPTGVISELSNKRP
jgi:murein L,D-transpeptidase YcbB/YkuD